MIALLLTIAALCIEPLPASVYADLAGTKRTVVFPAGEWRIAAGKEIRVTRSNLAIEARGAVLIPDPEVTVPFWVLSTTSGGLAIGTHQDGRRKAEGVVTPATRELTVADVSGMAVGNIVLLGLGLGFNDPAAPEHIAYREISRIRGNVVRFTKPLGVTPTVHKSFDALRELLTASGQGWQINKVGPWGLNPNGFVMRGLGTSHDLYCFKGWKPVENVTVNGLTIDWGAADRASYGCSALSAAFARNVVFRGCTVRHPVGSVQHTTCCEASGSEGLEITGKGRAQWYSEAAIAPAIGWSQWSGIDCFFRNVHADTDNFYLTNFEVAIVRSRIENVYVRSGPQSWETVHLGQGAYRNIVLDVTLGTPVMSVASQVENLTLVRDEVPSWLPTAGLSGTTRIGRRTFGPPEKIDLELVTDDRYFRVPRPDGLYKSARLVLESRDGIRAISEPGDAFGTDGLELPLKSVPWSHVRPGTIEDYYAAIHCVVWGKAGVRFRFQAELMPEDKE